MYEHCNEYCTTVDHSRSVHHSWRIVKTKLTQKTNAKALVSIQKVKWRLQWFHLGFTIRNAFLNSVTCFKHFERFIVFDFGTKYVTYHLFMRWHWTSVNDFMSSIIFNFRIRGIRPGWQRRNRGKLEGSGDHFTNYRRVWCEKFYQLVNLIRLVNLRLVNLPV